MSAQPCDLLLSGGFVVTMAEPGRVFWPGSVAIRGCDIVAVGRASQVEAEWRPAVTLDCGAQAILPGLVNCHVHAGMSLLKGRAGDRTLQQREVIWPFVEAITEKASYIGTRLACLQMMKSGITTFADMWPFPDANAEAVKSTGLRAVLAPYGRTYATGEIEALVSATQRWNDPRLMPAIGIHSLRACASETLHGAAEVARTHGLRVHMHAGENREDFKDGHDLFEIDALGLLRPGTILAGCIHFTKEEIDLAVERGSGVAHNPISNAQFGIGFAPLTQLMRRMPVGLGTDIAGADGHHDLFDEARMAVLADRGRGAVPALGPEDALTMATIGGAGVLGLDRLIGSLEAGKRADVSTVDLDDPRFIPLDRDRPEQILSHLLFVAASADVDTVIVDGQVVVRGGNVVNLDEEEIMSQGREISITCLAKARLA